MKPEEIEARLDTIGTKECRKWSHAIFTRHPPISKDLKYFYVRLAKEKGYVEANKGLLSLDKRLNWCGQSATIGHKEIKSLAEWYSFKATEVYEYNYKRTVSVKESCLSIRKYVRKIGLNDHFPKNWMNKAEEEVLALVKRFFDERWWRRSINKHLKQVVESVLRDMGVVRKQLCPYISQYGFHKYKQGRSRNDQMIDAMMLLADDEEAIPLRQAVDASVSNPEIQRAELMVRLRGIEDIAKEDGLVPLFITLTCPSKYHARIGRSGRSNPKYQGYTPKDGQQYLNKVNSEIRADLGKRGIKMAGFRIAEPHHDGTPHYHFLVYVKSEFSDLTAQIFQKHALKEDCLEEGADKYRCDVKELDLENGSATGYIAKYIAKNIDGTGVDTDYETGEQGDSSSLRVKAWASIWRIRQFQAIGSTPQTVYREFRRLPEALTEKYPKQAEQARKAADEGNYAEYIRANGGLFVGRKELPFRAMHLLKEKASKYGEDIQKIIGIVVNTGHSIVTRTKDYTLVPNWMLDTQKAARPPTLEYCQ